MFLGLLILIFTSCSIYEKEQVDYDPPKIVFENINIVQYENAKKKIFVTAELLESFTSKEILAASNLSFAQYSNRFGTADPKTTLTASAKKALLLQKQKQYFLGGNVFLQTEDQKFTVDAKNLFYDEAENMLYGVEGEEVHIQDKNGTEVTGKTFIANTLSQEFRFLENVSGKAQVEDTTETDAEENDSKTQSSEAE